MNEYKKASDIIDSIFSNFDKAKMNQSNDLSNLWNDILNKISIEGNKLADHTRLIDLQNNILIVEVDHAGWIQLLQFYRKFILKELNKNVPSLKIKTISFKINK
ncbi:MAG: DUF721 domain-containing protein [Treponemataceae bacterium]